MLSPVRPSPRRIRSFLDQQQSLPFGYREVGMTRGAVPDGYVRDHYRGRVGEGIAVYDRACDALRHWRMFEIGWAEVVPQPPPLPSEGTVIGILGQAYGLWSLFACRVSATIDEHGDVERSGFVYGTLPGHLLRGEERFLVEWERRDDSVWYDVLAYSQPTGIVGQVAHSLVRRVQKRFAPQSHHALLRAIEGHRS